MKILILILLSGALIAAEPGVVYSDGTRVDGEVRVAPGGQLRFHDGTTLRDLDPQSVRELRLVPTAEQQLRAFAMPEPGKTLRVETGEPYPQREFVAVIGLRDGSELRGHLYAVALLIAGPDEDVKVVLPAKQQGKPGERLDQLIYPSRVLFTGALPVQQSGPRNILLANKSTVDDLGVVTRDSLAPLLVTPLPLGTALPTGSWSCEPLLGSALYVALTRGATITVGWEGDEPALHQQIAKAVPDIRDYYEEKRLIAVRPVPPTAAAGSPQVDSLMLLIRRGPGTDGPRNPWHVEVWRWTVDAADSSRCLLSARGVLARGLFRTDVDLPTVTADAAWWPQQVDLKQVDVKQVDVNTLTIGSIRP